jgi:hypothetical protein
MLIECIEKSIFEKFILRSFSELYTVSFAFLQNLIRA